MFTQFFRRLTLGGVISLIISIAVFKISPISMINTFTGMTVWTKYFILFLLVSPALYIIANILSVLAVHKNVDIVNASLGTEMGYSSVFYIVFRGLFFDIISPIYSLFYLIFPRKEDVPVKTKPLSLTRSQAARIFVSIVIIFLVCFYSVTVLLSNATIA